MEGTPTDLSLEKVARAIMEVNGVENVRHLHVWELDEQHRALEAYIQTSISTNNYFSLRKKIKSLLEERFGIGHSTLELDASSRDDSGRCLMTKY